MIISKTPYVPGFDVSF